MTLWLDDELIREVKPWESPFTEAPEASNDHDEITHEEQVCRQVYSLPYDVSLVAILSEN